MDDDDDLGDLTLPAPAYKRALWIVTILNVGYGLIEAGGGFLAGSQGLKADALDFLGDGTITLLGLIAIGWGAALAGALGAAPGHLPRRHGDRRARRHALPGVRCPCA